MGRRRRMWNYCTACVCVSRRATPSSVVVTGLAASLRHPAKEMTEARPLCRSPADKGSLRESEAAAARGLTLGPRWRGRLKWAAARHQSPVSKRRPSHSTDPPFPRQPEARGVHAPFEVVLTCQLNYLSRSFQKFRALSWQLGARTMAPGLGS